MYISSIEAFRVWATCLFQLAAELSSQNRRPEASRWLTGQDPALVNLMGWILLFFALLHRHPIKVREIASLYEFRSNRQKQRNIWMTSVFQAVPLLFQGRKEVKFLPAWAPKAQQCPCRCQINSLLYISVRSQTAASLFPKTKGQLVFQMFQLASEWFLFCLPTASIPIAFCCSSVI